MNLGVGGINISRPGFVGSNNSHSTETNTNNNSTTTKSFDLDSGVKDTISHNAMRENQPETSVKIQDEV